MPRRHVPCPCTDHLLPGPLGPLPFPAPCPHTRTGRARSKNPEAPRKRGAPLLAALRAHVAQASAPLGWDFSGRRGAGRVAHAPAAPRFYKLRAQPPPALSAPPALQTARPPAQCQVKKEKEKRRRVPLSARGRRAGPGRGRAEVGLAGRCRGAGARGTCGGSGRGWWPEAGGPHSRCSAPGALMLTPLLPQPRP